MKNILEKLSEFKVFKCSIVLICLFTSIFLVSNGIEGWGWFLFATIVFASSGTINIGSSDKDDEEEDEDSLK